MSNYLIYKKPSWVARHQIEPLGRRLREQRRILLSRLAKPRSSHYILCRPRGGLNDSLVQIRKCHIHAQGSRRKLIIDAQQSGLRDHFSRYFKPVYPFSDLLTELSPTLLASLDSCSCWPKEFAGRLATYELNYIENIRNFVDSETGARPRIRAADSEHSVLLHDQCGGGEGIHALPYFKLTDSVSDAITESLQVLPARYLALHIRYSDVPFDLLPFLQSVKPLLDGRCALICTDSFKVLQMARQFLSSTELISIYAIPDTGGEPLHGNPRVTSPLTNIGALTDLIALACADELIVPAGPAIRSSGFTRLAVDLSSRNDLIRQLLGWKNWLKLISK